MQFCAHLQLRAKSRISIPRKWYRDEHFPEKFNESAIGDTVYREIYSIHDMRIR